MSDSDEYRCFIGGLAWSTSDRKLKDTFEKFGKLTEAKVISIIILLDVGLYCTFCLDVNTELLSYDHFYSRMKVVIFTELVY